MPFAFLFKNRFKKVKESMYKEFADKEKELRNELTKAHSVIEEKLDKAKKEQDELEEQEKRVLDRRKELARVNDELKTQIRLIEAKASPDSVWAEAFGHGFSKAWDMMVPVMMSGIEKVKEQIRNQEIEESLPRLNTMVNQRIQELGNYDLKPVAEIIAKKLEFSNKKAKISDTLEQQKYDNFIKTLDWVIGHRNGN